VKEIYVVTDIEADGPCPGINSMLSLASVAIDEVGNELEYFSINLLPMEGGVQDPDTMEFWKKNPKAWEATQKDQCDPARAMQSYGSWARELFSKYGKPVFVGEPVCFDFSFVYYYLLRYGQGKPFSHSGLDVKTLAMAALKCNYSEAVKRNFPKRWFNPKSPHTHLAIDDAREQAYIFIQILKELRDIQ